MDIASTAREVLKGLRCPPRNFLGVRKLCGGRRGIYRCGHPKSPWSGKIYRHIPGYSRAPKHKRPGVYTENYGVRVEEMILIGKRAKVLSRFPKSLEEIII